MNNLPHLQAARPAAEKQAREQAVICAEGLCKQYGKRRVLRGVDLALAAGDFLALFGPNGAGKTTLIRILASLTRPSSGRVRIMGLDPVRRRQDLCRVIGLVGHRPGLYGRLSARENLVFFAAMHDVPAPRRRAAELLALVGLEAQADEPVETFSRGMQQRLALARAVVHDPGVLLLDEPFTGLDAEGAGRLAEILAQYRQQGKTAVMSSHDRPQALSLCNRTAVLAGGRLVHEQPAAGADREAFRHAHRRLTAGRRSSTAM